MPVSVSDGQTGYKIDKNAMFDSECIYKEMMCCYDQLEKVLPYTMLLNCPGRLNKWLPISLPVRTCFYHNLNYKENHILYFLNLFVFVWHWVALPICEGIDKYTVTLGDFYPRPVWPIVIACVWVCVCVSVNFFVHAITHHTSQLE